MYRNVTLSILAAINETWHWTIPTAVAQQAAALPEGATIQIKVI
jgi:hypothetical protein